MDKRAMIADLMAKRAAKRAELDGLLTAVEAREEGKRELTDEERSAFEAGESEVRAFDERVAELDAQVRADEAAAEMAKRYAPSGVKVTSEPEVYRRGGNVSYFRDLHLARNKGDHQAAQRLQRNDAMVAEKRAISTTNGAGGEFVPPLWLEDEFIKFVRPGRITANLCPTMDLPPGTDSINIPKVNSGTAVAPQSSQNSGVQQTDLTTTSVASPVVTIAGGQTVSLQLLEQSPLNIDNVVLADLAADYAQKLNTQVHTGSGSGGQVTGISTLSGTNAVTFTSTTPTLGGTGANALFPKLANAIQLIHTKRFLPPTAIVMHPSRWAWCLSQSDASSRPLVTPRAGAYNPLGAMDGTASEGLVGEMLGLPVYVDATIPTNLGAGTNQDYILVARMSDLVLWESNVRAEAFQQTYAQNMSVFVRLYNYFSFQAGRYPQSISLINGTGLTTPSF
jgi:HK97 family phage major capsid protein